MTWVNFMPPPLARYPSAWLNPLPTIRFASIKPPDVSLPARPVTPLSMNELLRIVKSSPSSTPFA